MIFTDVDRHGGGIVEFANKSDQVEILKGGIPLQMRCFLHEKFCGHTEFLPRRSSEIPMENFTCKRLLSALKGGRSGLRATSTLRALLRASSVERHLHTCNTAAHLQRSNKTRRCGHSAVEYQLERDETCARDGERHECESIFCSHLVLYF